MNRMNEKAMEVRDHEFREPSTHIHGPKGKHAHGGHAFALPGGYVYVSRGILALTNNEDELAGVMGRENVKESLTKTLTTYEGRPHSTREESEIQESLQDYAG